MSPIRYCRLALPAIVLIALVTGVACAAPPAWVGPMKKVRARFTGAPGTLATFGDSITVSLAFWAPLRGEPRHMPTDMAAALALVKEYLRPECWAGWRGPNYGNEGSMTIRWAHGNVARWLKAHNPEVAVILFGTNDLCALDVTEYERKTAEVVERCLKNGTVVILTTAPPRSGFLAKSKDFAAAVRRVARDKHVPLIDYHAEILKRRPDDWDGALPKFKGVPGDEYEVPTLIARDGIHPSNPKAYQNFSPASLSRNGYALRNYLTLLAYTDVVRRVLPAEEAAVAAVRKAATFYVSFNGRQFVRSWTRLGAIGKGAEWALYIDGKSIGKVRGGVPAVDGCLENIHLYVAVRWAGLLDELAVFNRALAAEETSLLRAKPGLLAPLQK
jgi:lysophospholipase L1-like esterase